jgi:uncharacterized membrane protein
MTRTLLQAIAILAIAFFAGPSRHLSAQAVPAERGRRIQGEFSVRRALGLPSYSLSAAHHTVSAGSDMDAVALGLAQKGSYHFRSIDFPGSQYSLVLDFNDETAVGQFSYPAASLAFYFRGTSYHVLNIKGGVSSTCNGINASGQMVGAYEDKVNHIHGFLYNGKSVVTVDFPNSNFTEAWDINKTGVIVGDFYDANSDRHGFLDKKGVFTTIDFPGAAATAAVGINSGGDVVGFYYGSDDIPHGFLLSKKVYSPIDFPKADYTFAYGINDAGSIAGSFSDGGGDTIHGFVRIGGIFYQEDVAGAVGTSLFRINNDGNVAGYVVDVQHETHGIIGH